MTRIITISIDQFFRPQPGGIATYVRGLAQGLAQLQDPTFEVLGLAPRSSALTAPSDVPLRVVRSRLPLAALSRVWPYHPFGVPRESDVVHATSMAGPFGGGSSSTVHSVALHDLLWRDEPSATTSAGIRFHERRLRFIAGRPELRVFVTAPGLRERLVQAGIDERRIVPVRFGVDDDGESPARRDTVLSLLASHGVQGPFTLYAGTIEPRKNIERLIAAHALARAQMSDVGDLVLVGPRGWGDVATRGATVLGVVSRAMLKALYRDASVFAYVPRAEGFGLPPVEALHAGCRVVASTTTPSVADNPSVVHVEPNDVDAIAAGLMAALDVGESAADVAQRVNSVADLTWRNAALDHLAGWQ